MHLSVHDTNYGDADKDPAGFSLNARKFSDLAHRPNQHKSKQGTKALIMHTYRTVYHNPLPSYSKYKHVHKQNIFRKPLKNFCELWWKVQPLRKEELLSF